MCEIKPSKRETHRVCQLSDWFGPEQTNYRCDNTLRLSDSGSGPHHSVSVWSWNWLFMWLSARVSLLVNQFMPECFSLYIPTDRQAETYLIVDESSHSFDLQHVGLMGSQFMNKTVRSSVVPTHTNNLTEYDEEFNVQVHMFLYHQQLQNCTLR